MNEIYIKSKFFEGFYVVSLSKFWEFKIDLERKIKKNC